MKNFKARKRKRVAAVACTDLLGGHLTVPVLDSPFGPYLDLTDKLPSGTECIMVLVNSGTGLSAGYPKPIGFVKLPHQLYLADVNKILKADEKQQLEAAFGNGTRWLTVVPIRSSEYIDIWRAEPPNDEDEP